MFLYLLSRVGCECVYEVFYSWNVGLEVYLFLANAFPFYLVDDSQVCVLHYLKYVECGGRGISPMLSSIGEYGTEAIKVEESF